MVEITNSDNNKKRRIHKKYCLNINNVQKRNVLHKPAIFNQYLKQTAFKNNKLSILNKYTYH